jgi:hypothetical protein
MTMTMTMAMGIERFGWHLTFWNIVAAVAVCGMTYMVGSDPMLII